MIAAAGFGERLGAGGPKALVALAGRPLIAWCLDAFAAAGSIGRAVVASPPGHEDEIAALAPAGLATEVVTGGSSRSESVAAALERADAEIVAVHDAARPLVTPELIDAIVARLVSHPDAAGVIVATPVTDTVKRATGDELRVARTESREQLWAAQTPQVFRADALREAHAGAPQRLTEATDDAMLVEQAGGEVLIEPASTENLKVTNEADLGCAELLLGARAERWIRRAMPTLVAEDLEASRRFYSEFLGFDVVMEEAGFVMLASASNPTAQLIVCSPERMDWDPNTGRTQMAVEVGDVRTVYAEAQRRGLKIVYPLTDEPWGIRRFFVEAPEGTVLNLHSHIG